MKLRRHGILMMALMGLGLMGVQGGAAYGEKTDSKGQGPVASTKARAKTRAKTKTKAQAPPSGGSAKRDEDASKSRPGGAASKAQSNRPATQQKYT